MDNVPAINPSWDSEVDFAITVCNESGTIVRMNEKSKSTFQKENDDDLIGKNVLECHPPAAREKLGDLLKNHTTDAYTIEKNGQKKLIYQTPWYEQGEFRGLVELSLILPKDMPHSIRKN